MTYIQIEKRLRNPLLDAEAAANLPASEVFDPLPGEVADLLGPRAVDYDSFMATYLPPTRAQALLEQAKAHNLVAVSGTDRQIRLPWHELQPGDSSQRTAPGFPPGLGPGRALPRLYLAQFAYPLRETWIADLESCGIERIATFQMRTLLLRAASLGSILSCGDLPTWLSWIDSYRSTDRVSPELFQHPETRDFQLQFMPGTDLQKKRRGLGRGLQARAEPDELEERMGFLRVRGRAEELLALVAGDPDLLSASMKGEGAPSDERQGQIVAGNHDGATVTSPGYRNWLSSRGLLSNTNRQTVGVIDTGYDDGSVPDPATPVLEHHKDLENPQRLILPVWAPPSNVSYDSNGHGTMVAGIIAGEGATGTAAKDSLGFYYGSGIAPGVNLIAARPANFHLNRLEPALEYCRVDSTTGANRSFIVNNSYNNALVLSGVYYADNEYDEFSMFFDDKAIDASSVAGFQATTLIFSAGNFAYDYNLKTIRRDSIASPATAKNVITVGATASYRPAENPPLACQEDASGSRPPNQDALHIARLGLFSGRGKSFGPHPASSMVHNTRVKPDLVAPGIRVFSTVPWDSGFYTSTTPASGCTVFYPLPNANYYTYGTGTSFSAPVVTGVAALKRKWFLDRGTDPSPSLLKAALVATADTLGAFLGNDHRPSSNFGWGRVNLNRATDARARFYVKDNEGLAVMTGQQRTWTRTIDNPASDTYIVLVWSDPKSDVVGNSQATLKNNLGLGVDEFGSNFYWRGNNFHENRIGNDNGYSYRFTSTAEVPFSDSVNNVEAIFIPANTFPAGHKLTIKVTGENVTAGTQKFAVYAYNVQLSQ